MQSGFNIRPASYQDIPRLVELDRQGFSGDDMDVYGEKHFQAWLKVNPEGLIVAVNEQDEVVGYYYTQYLDFEPADIAKMTTNNAITDNGFTRKTHNPDGNTSHGVSVCSMAKGARAALFAYARERVIFRRQVYEFGYARVPGLSVYRQELVKLGINADAIPQKDLATWYVLGCARFDKTFVWDWVKQPELPCELPLPAHPDPVLNKYLKYEDFGVAAILPNWIKDPRSEHVGVMLLYRNPNVTPPAA